MAKSSRVHSPPSSESTLVISLDARFFYGLLVVIGLVVVFGAGLVLGGALKPAPAGLAVQPPSNPAAVPFQAQGSQVTVPLQGQPAQAAPGADPNLMRVAKPHAPDGDHPHIALPEVEQSNYTIEFGKMTVSGGPIEKVVTLKNTGNRDLVLQTAKGS